MTHLFVPRQQSLELKELGFNQPCISKWEEDYLCQDEGFDICNQDTWLTNTKLHYNKKYCTAPLWEQAFQFFIDHYGLDAHITYPESKTNIVEGINSVYYDIEIYTLSQGDAHKTYRHMSVSPEKLSTYAIAIAKLIELAKIKSQKTCQN